MTDINVHKGNINMHPLGGAKTFHTRVKQTADNDTTTQRLKTIRDTLLMGASEQRNGQSNHNDIRIEKNPIAVNNAHEAVLYRGIPNNVRNGALLPLGKRTKSRITSIMATKCHRWQTDSELAHACDVLGPYSCADCIRARMQKQVSDVADRTFPGIEVSERDLCTEGHFRNMLSPLPGEMNRLPPILEAGYAPDTPMSNRGKSHQWSSSHSGNARRRSYNSRKMVPLQKRPNKPTGLLPITNAELQRRVFNRKLTREVSNTSSILFTPRGVIQEDTEPSLAPTPRIRVEIQIPMISTNSRETSKHDKVL